MAESWTISVYSSNVDTIGYDADSGEMIVTWHSGKRSAYAGVPEELALQVSKAPSVGRMLNEQIKPSFSHRYV